MPADLTLHDIAQIALEIASREPQRPAGAFTTDELRQATGWGQNKALRFVREGVRGGRVEVIQFEIKTIAGRPFTTTGYRIKEEEE